MTDHFSSIHYVTPDALCWQRQKHGKGFRFLNENGSPLNKADTDRIKKLVIPPAWTDVRICGDYSGHIQAIGLDARGRKQYIYHPVWVQHNQQQKFDKMVRFGEILPTLRETVASHMREHKLSRDRVVATVVWLLEHTFIRVGNSEYAQENKSYGLTTLREKHVDVEGNTISFSFKGKSGVYHELDVKHPRVAKTIKQCIELPGFEIFQYLDEDKQRQIIDSRDVNDYLHSITGEHLSAKDFRTWGGSVLAGKTLYTLGQASSETEAKRFLNTAVKEVASHLRNTKTVCRKYYIHPRVVAHHEDQTLVPYFDKAYKHEREAGTFDLSTEERATWELLKK
jgi:DNA topoisomerase I